MPQSPNSSSSRPARYAVAQDRWASIRLLAMDVDGVLTDGTVRIHSDGTESKSFSIHDGLGLRLLLKAGVTVALISGRSSEATAVRAKELGIAHVIQGRTDKATSLQNLATRLSLMPGQCAYMGDDIIDVPAMAWAEIAIAPPGAMPAALAVADYVTQREAGHGAVREVCELMLSAQSDEKEVGAKTKGRGRN